MAWADPHVVFAEHGFVVAGGASALGGVLAGAANLAERRSLLVWLRDAEGRVGLGEAAPLPGYSSDSFEGSERWLRAQGGTSLGSVDERRLPALAFALFAARVDLGARQRGTGIVQQLTARLGTTPQAKTSLVGALLGRLGDRDLARAASQALDRGARVLKIKHSGTLDAEALEGLDRVLELARGRAADVRVDYGRSLEPGEVARELGILVARGVSRVEEPSRGAPAGPCPAELSGRVLLDESLLGDPEEALRMWGDWASGLVLKPTVLGPERTLGLAEVARERGLSLTVTHCFEGPVGLAHVRALALALGADVAGVDDHAALAAFPRCAVPGLGQREGALVLTPWREPGIGLDWPGQLGTSGAQEPEGG